MRNLFLIISALTSLNVLAINCKEELASKYAGEGHDVLSVKFISNLENGKTKYVITTNYFGGDGADEVIMNNKCQIVSRKTIWDE